MIPLDVDRVLDGIFISGPITEPPVGPKANQLAGNILNADNWVSVRLLGRKPRRHALQRTWTVIVDCRRVNDGLIKDGENSLRMRFLAAVDHPCASHFVPRLLKVP